MTWSWSKKSPPCHITCDQQKGARQKILSLSLEAVFFHRIVPWCVCVCAYKNPMILDFQFPTLSVKMRLNTADAQSRMVFFHFACTFSWLSAGNAPLFNRIPPHVIVWLSSWYKGNVPDVPPLVSLKMGDPPGNDHVSHHWKAGKSSSILFFQGIWLFRKGIHFLVKLIEFHHTKTPLEVVFSDFPKFQLKHGVTIYNSWAMEKPGLFRVYRGIILPSYMGNILNHYKDPSWSTRIQLESNKFFFISWLNYCHGFSPRIFPRWLQQ